MGIRVRQKGEQADSEVTEAMLQQMDSILQKAITEIELLGKK